MTNLRNIEPIKKIKVGLTYTTPTKYKNNSYPVPSIRISGKYLETHGFFINDVFEISSDKQGTIILKKLDPQKITLKEKLKQKLKIDDTEADILIRFANSLIFEGADPSEVLENEFQLTTEEIKEIRPN